MNRSVFDSAPVLRRYVFLVLLASMIMTLTVSPLHAVDWEAKEDKLIENGLQAETIPQDKGEVTLEFTNVTGADTTRVSNSNVADTRVTHLSNAKYTPEVTPVQYVSPGDSVTFRVRLRNTGNGPDTYSIRQRRALVNTWDTGIYLDTNENGELDSGESEITSSAQINNVVSLDTSHIILEVTIPTGQSVAERDTFTVFSRSRRTEDSEPGFDTTHMVVQTDTSSVDVFDTDPARDFVDTQTITGDTRIKMNFQSLENADSMNITYVAGSDTVKTTGFVEFRSDSVWTLSDTDGLHEFYVQYRFDDGGLSDTYTDSITLDHTPPQNPSVLIDNGDDTTATFDVILSSLDQTSDSNHAKVEISNDSMFSTKVDTRDVDAQGALINDTSWTINAAGQVFVRFIDKAGNRSRIGSDTIGFAFGIVEIEKDQYEGLDAQAKVTVTDFGANNDPNSRDKIDVRITSDQDATGLKITATEIGDDTGQFTGTFRFTQGQTRSDMIKVNPNSQVTASYTKTDGTKGDDKTTWVPSQKYLETVEFIRTWPNPYKPLSGKPFVFQKMPADPNMTIKIFNVQGQMIRKLTVGRGIQYYPTGNIARWFGRNDVGERVASGIYIYVIESKYGVKKGKLTLIK
ncbi:MAG: hypothetical protein ABEK50_06970 [bacterium]